MDAVLRGRVQPLGARGAPSAIAKQPLDGPVWLGESGLDGDEQGDRRVHGGPDKAVHHYAFDHYATWRWELGPLPALQAPGGFGENLSSHGLTETDVCLGDRLRIGTAVVEVSQARQPCWKLNERFAVPDMARRVQHTLRTGWYYRVLQPGWVAAGDPIVLLEQPHAQWPVRRVMEVLYRRGAERQPLEELLALPLVPSWRRLVEGRLQRGEVEDWTSRLQGPQA